MLAFHTKSHCVQVASPSISDSDHSTIFDGWLNKQSFNISKSERSKVATRE